MHLIALTSGPDTPSTRFRVAAYSDVVRAAGHTIELRHAWPPLYTHSRWLGWRLSVRTRRLKRRWDLRGLQRADAVLIERQLFDADQTDIEREVRRRAARLVYDVDDAIHRQRPAKFATLWGHADCVIAGNDWLAEAVREHCGDVVTIPTSVDTKRFRPVERTAKRPGERLRIGWTGTSSNLPQLAAIGGAIESLGSQVELEVISDANPDAWAALRDWAVPVTTTRWTRAEELAALSRFDIGVMPLADTEWNRGKCGFKLIQYLATGLPAIASPLPVNAAIAGGGAALLADSADEWTDALRRLVGDAALRAELSDRGPRRVAESYSIASQSGRWMAAVFGDGL